MWLWYITSVCPVRWHQQRGICWYPCWAPAGIRTNLCWMLFSSLLKELHMSNVPFSLFYLTLSDKTSQIMKGLEFVKCWKGFCFRCLRQSKADFPLNSDFYHCPLFVFFEHWVTEVWINQICKEKYNENAVRLAQFQWEKSTSLSITVGCFCTIHQFLNPITSFQHHNVAGAYPKHCWIKVGFRESTNIKTCGCCACKNVIFLFIITLKSPVFFLKKIWNIKVREEF